MTLICLCFPGLGFASFVKTSPTTASRTWVEKARSYYVDFRPSRRSPCWPAPLPPPLLSWQTRTGFNRSIFSGIISSRNHPNQPATALFNLRASHATVTQKNVHAMAQERLKAEGNYQGFSWKPLSQKSYPPPWKHFVVLWIAWWTVLPLCPSTHWLRCRSARTHMRAQCGHYCLVQSHAHSKLTGPHGLFLISELIEWLKYFPYVAKAETILIWNNTKIVIVVLVWLNIKRGKDGNLTFPRNQSSSFSVIHFSANKGPSPREKSPRHRVRIYMRYNILK